MQTTKRLKPKNLLLSLVAFLLFSSQLLAEGEKDYIIGERVTFHSEILGEDRTILVNLPVSYHYSGVDYPVLYVLDGGSHFHHVSGITTFLSAMGKIPEMIVVAVTNVDRTRDFSPAHIPERPTTGGAEKFRDFIEKELMPFTGRNYRTMPYSILVGHSFGGTFATYSLLSSPQLFNGFIAISPYLMFNDGMLVNQAEKKLKTKYKDVYFYMSLGDEPAYVETLSRFEQLVKDKGPAGFYFTYTHYPEENHGSVPHLSVYDGLKWIFSDFPLPEEKFREGLPAIDEHYASLSKKYGQEARVPEALINRLGYMYLNNGYADKAISTFKTNIARYPESANAYDSLGEAYEKAGQPEEAKKNYGMAVEKARKTNHPNLNIYLANQQRLGASH